MFPVTKYYFLSRPSKKSKKDRRKEKREKEKNRQRQKAQEDSEDEFERLERERREDLKERDELAQRLPKKDKVLHSIYTKLCILFFVKSCFVPLRSNSFQL